MVDSPADPATASPTPSAEQAAPSEEVATVPDVTPAAEPQPADPAADPSDEPVTVPADEDRSGIGTTGDDGVYTPAPPSQRPGEPPAAPYTPPPAVAPLPGEFGYQGPVARPEPPQQAPQPPMVDQQLPVDQDSLPTQ